MKPKRWVIIPILCIFLAGCTTAAPVSKPARLTLPPPQPETAPAGDALQEFAETVQLHVPDSLGSQLTVISEKILMPQNRHPADETVRKLLLRGAQANVSNLLRRVQKHVVQAKFGLPAARSHGHGHEI